MVRTATMKVRSSLLLESQHLFNEDNSSLSLECQQLLVEEIFKPPKHQVDANQTGKPIFFLKSRNDISRRNARGCAPGLNKCSYK